MHARWVTAGGHGLCCLCTCDVFQALINSLVLIHTEKLSKTKVYVHTEKLSENKFWLRPSCYTKHTTQDAAKVPSTVQVQCAWSPLPLLHHLNTHITSEPSLLDASTVVASVPTTWPYRILQPFPSSMRCTQKEHGSTKSRRVSFFYVSLFTILTLV